MRTAERRAASPRFQAIKNRRYPMGAMGYLLFVFFGKNCNKTNQILWENGKIVLRRERRWGIMKLRSEVRARNGGRTGE